jgi:hypothetical protein
MPTLPSLTFPYRVVEKALAVACGIAEEKRHGGFRSLVGNLQKLGALGAQARVGRGVALNYTPLEIHRLLVSVECCELGLPPGTAVGLVNSDWETRLQPIVSAALDGLVRHEPGGDDVILYLRGVSFRTYGLRGETTPAPDIGRCTLNELPAEMKRWLSATPNDSARALVVNLSARLRIFHDALSDANLDDALDERQASLVGDEPPPKARKRAQAQMRSRR